MTSSLLTPTPTTTPILVCGGAGYIGSHMCKQLAQAGYLPVTFDNLSTGHRWAVQWGPLVEGDLLDTHALRDAFARWPFAAVMHFAALSQVGQSMAEPERYFRNNVTGTLNLLEAMQAAGVQALVFSSTAAVYGNPASVPISEDQAQQPINPYGWSKLMAERMIAEQCRAHELRAACLRYFNAAGADPDGQTGEAHEPETHLIPNVLKVALGQAPAVPVFGADYDTPDGTCIRDYIHVVDLARGHVCAIKKLETNCGLFICNLGTGKGYSVLDVIHAFEKACGKPIPYVIDARRPGDIAECYADPTKAKNELGWVAEYGIEEMCADSWNWQKNNPDGYHTVK